MSDNGNGTTEIEENFKLYGCDVRVVIVGERTRHQAMHDIITFIDSKQPPKRKRRSKAELEAAGWPRQTRAPCGLRSPRACRGLEAKRRDDLCDLERKEGRR